MGTPNPAWQIAFDNLLQYSQQYMAPERWWKGEWQPLKSD